MTMLDLKKHLFDLGIDVSDEKLTKLERYLDFMLEYNNNVNLTAIKNKEEAIEKHLFDSLLIAKDIDLSNKEICDIGSGAGLPGIPLAILFDNAKFSLIEPTKKRAVFLEKVIELLSLDNVRVINDRAENLTSLKERYDFAISRAVAQLNILLELSCQLIKVNGYLIAMKSRLAEEELDLSKNAMKQLSFDFVANYKSTLPISNEIRNNIILRKTNKTKNKYPRQYALISRRPL